MPTRGADQGKPRAGYSTLRVDDGLSRSRIIINQGMSADAIGVQDFRRIVTTPFVKRYLNPMTFIWFMWCGQFDNLLDKVHVYLFLTSTLLTFGGDRWFFHDRFHLDARNRFSTEMSLQREIVRAI